MPTRNGFTFYADLLGIGSSYLLSSRAAYDKLNRFYNVAFRHLSPHCIDETLKVNLFSDSILVWGSNPIQALETLQPLYQTLLQRGLLLRGAMVDGRLERDPRIEVVNLQKFLPSNDALARAVGLEKTVKGARLVISSALGEALLLDNPPWRTIEGYVDHVNSDIPPSSILRRICPIPEGTSYELLYFWETETVGHRDRRYNYRTGKARLREISKYVGKSQAIHYRETINLMKRCELRERSTMRRLTPGI